MHWRVDKTGDCRFPQPLLDDSTRPIGRSTTHDNNTTPVDFRTRRSFVVRGLTTTSCRSILRYWSGFKIDFFQTFFPRNFKMRGDGHHRHRNDDDDHQQV
jgi:hypothetical protein